MGKPLHPGILVLGLNPQVSGAVALLVSGGICLSSPPALAQSITPNSDGLNTDVQYRDAAYWIEGGTVSENNLFHSFEQFGLSANETAIFLTQPEIVNVLGRINGGDASIINGQLQLVGSGANLFLINPVGVLFGPDTRLNLPGNLAVATADGIGFGQGSFNAVGPVDPAELIGSPQSLLFYGSNGALVNAGDLTLEAGQTLLLAGSTVVNTGTVTAAGGGIAIAAVPSGNRLRLTPSGSLLSYEVAAGAGAGLTPLTLPALLTGQGIAGLSLEDETVQLAQLAIPTDVGTVIVSGVLDVSNPDGVGGTLTLTGDTTGVIGALLTAAGQDGGGEILIGGSYLGQGPLPSAQVTYVDETAVLTASADRAGDGGRVIVWSDQTTRSYGQILARGGSEGGDGGFVETSSRGFLDVGTAVPDILAPAGTAGTWLLDPGDISIDSTTDINITGASPFRPTGDSAVLSTGVLVSAINAGGTVVVSTVGAPGTQAGNISVDAPIFFDPLSGAELILLAESTISINADIAPASSTSGPLTLRLIADANNTGTGQVVLGNGGTTLNTNGGNLTVQANSTNLFVADPSAIRIPNGTTVSTNNPFTGVGGNILFSGTANTRPGVNLETGSNLSSGDGAIALTGTSTLDSGVLLNGVITNNNTPLVVTGNSSSASAFGVHIDNGILSGIGNLTVVGNNAQNVGIQFDVSQSTDAIQLTSDRDIVVNALNTTDGNLTINAGRFFRSNGVGVSLESETGSVTVRHGGNGLTPFIVGDSSLNGTAGDIRAAASTALTPTQSFLGSFTQGNISILTNDALATIQALLENQPGFLDCLGSCASQALGHQLDNAPGLFQGNRPQISIGVRSGTIREQLGEKFTQLEGNYANEYTRYLGLDDNSFPEPDIPQLQEDLTLVAEATGIRPAIVYVAFVPSTVEQIPPESRSALPPQHTARSKNDLWRSNADGATGRLTQPDDQLELILVTPDRDPIRQSLSITHQQIQDTANQLRREVTNPSRIGSRTYLVAAQQLYQWVVEPLQATLSEQEIENLAFVMPPGLRSLPLSVLHDGEGFLIERYSLGLVPSVSLTDLRYVDVRNSEVLAMGASSFTDQPELPAVPIELTTIAEQIWPGEFLLNETFTPDALVSQRQQTPYGIVHLATHGEFSAGQIDNSYIQFWDQRLGIDQVRSLQLSNPPVELMVLSACRTALGNEEAELGFAGLAVQSGVKTVLASLWKVDDLGTAGLMTQFYSSLREAPIKSEALRQAQLAMLNGEISVEDRTLRWSSGAVDLPSELPTIDADSFQHPFFWSAFTIVGSPW